MGIDWIRLAQLIKHDRGVMSQGDYGQQLGGLSQGQVSDLENAKMRRPTAPVIDALRRRFGELPEVAEEIGSAGDEMHELLELMNPEGALDPFAGLPGGAGARQRHRDLVAEMEARLAKAVGEIRQEYERRRQALLDEARYPKKR